MKKNTKTRNITIRLTEEDFKLLIKIRNESEVSTSEMIRNSIQFYAAFYTKPNEN